MPQVTSVADGYYALPEAAARYLRPGIPSDSEVLARIPTLRRSLTPRDALLPIQAGVEIEYAWLTTDGYELDVHPGLRRYMNASANTELLDLLRDEVGQGTRVSIGIDHWRLSALGTHRRVIELDAWFGARFDSSRLDDSQAIGTVVHGRPVDMSPAQKAGMRMEIRWSWDAKEQIKTLELEELPAPSAAHDGATHVACRYVHAQRHAGRREFIHLDGAVKVYSVDHYGTRYASAMDHRAERVWADKVKVFRIDAPTGSILNWNAVIVAFFRQNELVLEYFEGRPYSEIYREAYGHEHPWIETAARAAGDRANGTT